MSVEKQIKDSESLRSSTARFVNTDGSPTSGEYAPVAPIKGKWVSGIQAESAHARIETLMVPMSLWGRIKHYFRWRTI